MSNTRKQQRARSPQRARKPRRGPRRRRWLLVSACLALAGLAAWAALQGGALRGLAGDRAPLDDIDDASRVRLERVLRDADLAEGR